MDDTCSMGHVASALTESDLALVRLGAKQTARALAKLVARGHIPGILDAPYVGGSAVVIELSRGAARVAAALFGELRDACEGLGDTLWAEGTGASRLGSGTDPDAPCVPILPLRGADVVVPAAALRWPGFSLLAHLADDCSMFAGPLQGADPQLHVSLLPLASLPSVGGAAVAPPALRGAAPAPLVLNCAGAWGRCRLAQRPYLFTHPPHPAQKKRCAACAACATLRPSSRTPLSRRRRCSSSKRTAAGHR